MFETILLYRHRYSVCDQLHRRSRLSATTSGSIDREPTDKELQGGIMGYGVTNILGALLGGLSTATYSQNVGIVTTTEVVNRCVLGLTAPFSLRPV